MSKEKQPQFKKNKYYSNRLRAFKAYGIKINDPEYNCHHIVQKTDLEQGLVPHYFDIDGLPNLFPIRIDQHELLNKIIYAVDNDQDISCYLDEWKKLETDSKKPKVVSKKTINHKTIIPIPPTIDLTKKSKKKPEKHRQSILEKLIDKEADEYLSYYQSSLRTNLAEI